MRVYSLNNVDYSYNPVNFGINSHSKRLEFKKDDFFVKIYGYGSNSNWAKKIMETADSAVNFIRKNVDFESILRFITSGVREANQMPFDLNKREHTGILRTPKAGWKYGSEWSNFTLITKYGRRGRYKGYNDRLDYTLKNPVHNPYRDISLTRPKIDKQGCKYLEHGDSDNIDSALNRVNSIYDSVHEKYIVKEVSEEDLTDINSMIAEIRWILAHATPWERGSDAISNTFMRSVYKSAGIKTYPLKKGVSLDLEAYCTELKDYKKNFANYFLRKPEIVD